jgi:hypothetical protein
MNPFLDITLTHQRIHKPKYSEDKESSKPGSKKEKKSRSKSRTRTIFGLRSKEKEKDIKDTTASV